MTYNKIWFVHIPKTGGVSIAAWLRRIFGAENVQRLAPGTGGQNNFDPSKRVIVSHLYSEEALSYWRQERYFVFTFLRDPIERTLAHYHHVKRDPAFTETHELLQKTPLLDWLQMPRYFGATRNMMTKYWCDHLRDPHWSQYKRARDRLRKMTDFIGFTNRLNSDLKALALIWHKNNTFPDLGGRLIEALNEEAPWLNTWSPDDRATQEVLDEIITNNQHDLNLYAYFSYMHAGRPVNL